MLKEIYEKGLIQDVADELYQKLGRNFTCPRCGRSDMPLYFFPEHDKSCIFECAIDGPALDEIERLRQRIDDLEDLLREDRG